MVVRDGNKLQIAPISNGGDEAFGYTGPPMSKVCAVCGKKPSFGHNRSHSMVSSNLRPATVV